MEVSTALEVVEQNILFVEYYQKIGQICFYTEVVHDKYPKSFKINV